MVNLSKKKTNTGIFAAFIIVLMIPVLLVGSIFICVPFHDLAMWRFRQSIYDLPTGKGAFAQLLDVDSRFGLLWGNSNHCDAQVIALYGTTMDSGEFSAFAEKTIKNINYPFGRDVNFFTVYTYKNHELYLVSAGREYKVVKDSQYSNYLALELSSDYSLDFFDYSFIKTMFEKHIYEGVEGGKLYLLVFSDQSFSGVDINTDFRCN